jgi:hypothetical protein
LLIDAQADSISQTVTRRHQADLTGVFGESRRKNHPILIADEWLTEWSILSTGKRAEEMA